MSSVISAIGTANPQYSRNQLDTGELVSAGLHLKPAEKRLLKSLYRATGIQTRHSVLSDYSKNIGEFEFFPNDADSTFPTTSQRMDIFKENALPLALHAIQDCLASHPTFIVTDITHVITVSCTGMYAPGIDIEIIQALGLKSTTARVAINFMGCYGSFNALKVADAICKADVNANVLVMSVELCTLHFQKNTSLDSMISNAIFSDGAAAVLVQTLTNQTKYLSLDYFHNDIIPQTANDMAWKISDYGFDIVLSSYVPEAIEKGIKQFMQALLEKATFSVSDIDIFAVHPGGLKILEATESALSLSKNDNRYSYKVLENFGNMSSATILFVLKEIWQDNDFKKDQQIFSCAFGPGLTLESMLLKTHTLPS